MMKKPAGWKASTNTPHAYFTLLDIAAVCSVRSPRPPDSPTSRRPFEDPGENLQRPEAEREKWKPGQVVDRDLTQHCPYYDLEYTLELRQASGNLSAGQWTINNVHSSDELLAELDALKKLSHDWDSYSAPAPSRAAVKNAKALVLEAGKLGAEPERVEPSAMGGVGVTFSAGPREVVVEFYNNGTAHALFSDDATGDMSTRAVSTTREGRHGIIGEVRNHLHGENTAT